MKRKKEYPKKIHPQSDPQGLYKTPAEDKGENKKLIKRDLKVKKLYPDLIEELDHPE